ncbi:MAG: hypothetical protein RLZZ156_2123 [Deinococcota bacterium]|jgi:hypothetical protein
MAKMTCKCGLHLDNQKFPNGVILWVYTDIELDSIMSEKMDISDIPSPSHEVWKCPNCQRVYVFVENTLIRTYVLEF